ncbi:hypothetical protein [Telmatospirillum sp. J64-1]|uniref:hypothetical protein n=1 Tax=Telmatospirillum sp. J64-1 TaxID=2502183 RepID=UPI00115EE621|nr:hypothetical protein [Telmatospirillum sp. J64-1]
MSQTIRTEKRLLTDAEFEVVNQTHYPTLSQLSQDDLAGMVRRLREFRDKARDIARQQRREMRGKADPRGARPASDNSGTKMKNQIFSDALKRTKRELSRRLDADKRAQRLSRDAA